MGRVGSRADNTGDITLADVRFEVSLANAGTDDILKIKKRCWLYASERDSDEALPLVEFKKFDRRTSVALYVKYVESGGVDVEDLGGSVESVGLLQRRSGKVASRKTKKAD